MKKPRSLKKPQLLVQFAPDGHFFISGGCNHFIGRWSMQDNLLTVFSLASTQMVCEEHLMQLDNIAVQLFNHQHILILGKKASQNNQPNLLLQAKGHINFTMQAKL